MSVCLVLTYHRGKHWCGFDTYYVDQNGPGGAFLNVRPFFPEWR